MIENRTAFALLGFLTWRPMSGYDLKQVVARSVGNFWSEGYSQIYPMLKALAEEGWVTRQEDDRTGRRIRHVYGITARGRAALRAWLSAPVADRPPRNELLLKLFFGDEVPLPVCLAHVESARARAAAALARYREIAADLARRPGPDPRMPFWRMTLLYGLDQAEAQLGWCDRALEELRALAAKDADRPGRACGAAGLPPAASQTTRPSRFLARTLARTLE